MRFLKWLAVPCSIVLFVVALIIKIVSVLVGFFVCAYGVFKMQDGPQKSVLFVRDGVPGTWVDKQLPDNLWLWSNKLDGLFGDKRGEWFVEYCGARFNRWTAYQWCALRNPANNLRHINWLSAYLPNLKIWWAGSNQYANDKKGKDGWYFAWARNKETGFCYFGFVAWIPYELKVREFNYRVVQVVYDYFLFRGLHIKAGWKIAPKHLDKSLWSDRDDKNRKGMTFYINPFREVRA